MKALIIHLVFVCLLFSCSNMCREKIVDKSELTGGDYRLFQNTPAWELAKAVEDGNTAQLKGTSSAKTDQTPWCAVFVNYCLETADVDGTMMAAAYSFKKWGQSFPTAESKFGAIAIMNYSHVGFVVGKNKNGRIVLLGGNQKDAINLGPNPGNLVSKFVYPTDYSPTSMPLPSMNIKGRSLYFKSSR